MPIVSIKQVLERSFDYVIVGGGTAGLVLAARLTEDPKQSVLVLEAGEANLNDPAILRSGQYGSHFGQPRYSSSMKTVAQSHTDGREGEWFRGRGLGGSSAINFICWTQPPKEDIDDWEKLGNKGWNWDDLSKYSKKCISFVPVAISPEEATKRGLGPGSGWDKPFGDGPIKLTHPKVRMDVDIKFQETLHNMGIRRAPGTLDGDPAGTNTCPNNLDPDTGYRSYATTAYFTPNADRPNFVVITSAYVHRIISSSEGGEIVASGVEFTHEDDGSVHIARATKEVILSAGALKSPQVLELSGIGRREVLQKINVPVILELEGVGENVQEHVATGISFKLKDSVTDETLDVVRLPGEAEKHLKLLAQSKGVFAMGLENLTYLPLHSYSDNADAVYADIRDDISRNIQEGKYSQGLIDQYRLQLARLEQRLPAYEIVTFPSIMSPYTPLPGKKYFTVNLFNNNTFSRGTIHAGSSDPKASPIIDPHYFENDIDLRCLVEMAKFVRKVALHAPFKDSLDPDLAEVGPGPTVQTDAEIAGKFHFLKYIEHDALSTCTAWLRRSAGSGFHTMGTLSMLPKEKGGVVDSNLKVYGTKNIRVVDLSIVPLAISCHTQWAAYVVAEKAADIISGKVSV